MRAPAWWWREADATPLWARALSPLGRFIASIGRARRRRGGYRAGVPVVCVGNLVAGGAGKTPLAIAIGERLAREGVGYAFLSRGYGGRERGPLLVDPPDHSAREVGDEPLLLAAFAPAIVARDRAAGAREAMALGAEAIVMDDGFQNPGLHKDFSILAVDGEVGFGNRRLLPAGPLREPIDEGLARADAVVVIGGEALPAELEAAGAPPVIRARLKPVFAGLSLSGARVIAFAGVARPEKFFAMLKRAGASLVETVALSDHERLSPIMLERLSRKALAEGAQLLTTEKDMIRAPAAYRPLLTPVPARLAFDPDESARLDALIEPLVDRALDEPA